MRGEYERQKRGKRRKKVLKAIGIISVALAVFFHETSELLAVANAFLQEGVDLGIKSDVQK